MYLYHIETILNIFSSIIISFLILFSCFSSPLISPYKNRFIQPCLVFKKFPPFRTGVKRADKVLIIARHIHNDYAYALKINSFREKICRCNQSQIRRNLVDFILANKKKKLNLEGFYLGGGLNNEFVLEKVNEFICGEVKLSVCGIATERNKTARLDFLIGGKKLFFAVGNKN